MLVGVLYHCAQYFFPFKFQNFIKIPKISTSSIKHGTLVEGEGIVQLTSLYKQVRSAAFNLVNIIYIFTKQAALKRSLN
jgi:hypothetical protein